MTLHRLRRSALATLAAVSLFAAGCGGSPEDDVKDTVKDLASAVKDKDYKAICDAFAKDTLKALEKAVPGGDCAKALEKEDDGGAEEGLGSKDPDDIKFEKVSVKGEKATVEVEGEDEPIEFVKEDGDWKVTIPGA